MEPVHRFRAGWMYPISNVVAGTVLSAGMVLVGIIAVGARLTDSHGADLFWAVVAGLLTLLGFLVGLAILGSGINALRPVLLDRTCLRLPTFTIRRGFGHLDIPLDDIAGVEMIYRTVPRNSRWQLSVIRLHNSNAGCDSLSSARSRTRGIAGTSAERVTSELRRALPTDRLARWNLP